MSAVPIPYPLVQEKRRPIILQGAMPSPADLPSGCHFRTRCPSEMDICTELEPEWRDVAKDHRVACQRV